MKENIKNENRRFLLVNLFLIVLLVSDIAVILFVSIPQIYSFMIAFLENMIFHKKMNERWHLFGSKAIIIVGIVLIIETTINLMLLNNKKQHKNDIYS
jgi:hypothetical protein